MTDALRTTFRFRPDEADFAALLKRPGSGEATAVSRLSRFGDLSEATPSLMLHALVDIAMRAIREEKGRIEGEKLAAFLATDDEHQRWTQSRRNRRNRRGPVV